MPTIDEQYSAELELLKRKSLADLKEMAKELGVPISSKLKKKSDWIEAIVLHCSSSDDSKDEIAEADPAEDDMISDEDFVFADEEFTPRTPVDTRSSGMMDTSSVRHGTSGYPQSQFYPQTQGTVQQNPQRQSRYGYDAMQPRRRTVYPQSQNPDNGGYAAYPMGVQSGIQSSYRSAAYPGGHRQQEEQITELYPMDDTGIDCEYVLEVMPDGYGFLRSNHYLSGPNDVYVSGQQVKKYKLRTGDIIRGKTRRSQSGEKYPPLLRLDAVNGVSPENIIYRVPFDELIPIYPDERITLERKTNSSLAIRLIDLFAPIGKGQRGLIVSQPKAGKTTLLKDIANSITENHPDLHLIVLLIDERPEEVTDIKRSIRSDNPSQVEVIYSTFDELPDHHTKVAEMTMERSMRLVEHGRDVVVLMDSITRLARAYNITMPATGKTLSGGMDPSALFKPKRFFGAARNIENGGSLTIIATALVETGSRMDDMVYEEFKGTGNMEIHLDRSLSEKRIFPAIDIYKSGTRHDDLLLSPKEYELIQTFRRTFSSSNTAEVTEIVLNLLSASSDNEGFIKGLAQWVEKNLKG